MRCLTESCSCAIAAELRQAFEVAKTVDEIMPELTQLAALLIEVLGELVKSGFLPTPHALGRALGASFDLCVSLLYASHAADTGWLYCPKQPYTSFYPYTKICPRCGRDTQEVEAVTAHKPASDRIGRYTSLTISALLSEILRKYQSGWSLRLLDSSRGDIDLLLWNEETLVLCEVKASPLTALTLSTPHEFPPTKDSDGEPKPIMVHTKIDITEWKKRTLQLYLAGHNIPLQSTQESPSFVASMCGRDRNKLVEDIKRIVDIWGKMMDGYESRWREHSHLRWFTFGCGTPVDDSKNAPGLDRTDDIKKGLYQMLKLSERYRMNCQARQIRVGLVSNVHPVAHYETYLSGFEEAVWTHENRLRECETSSGKEARLKAVSVNDLSPFYDMLFTFTRSWFRDSVLEQTFSLEALYHALGGNNGA